MAIGAWLVTLCDGGGAYSTRARAMLTMTIGGVVVRLVAGAVGPHFWLAVLLMLAGGTGLSLLRVLGDVGAKVGSLLVVMLALTLGAGPLAAPGAAPAHRNLRRRNASAPRSILRRGVLSTARVRSRTNVGVC